MKQVIGLATKFYTLWNYEAVTQYRSDSYGKYHPVGIDHKYYFIKNISTDLDKVTSQYPNLQIDMGLRGTTTFVENEKLDLPVGYFWGGKYSGRLIDEVIETDLQYCIWSANNYFNQNSEYIMSHPKYIQHFEEIERENNLLIEQAQTVKVGDVVELEFISNGYNSNDDNTECWVSAILGDTEISVCCNGVKRVSGRYPYLMPMINGKTKKTKGKVVSVTVTEVFNTSVYDGVVRQQIRVA